MCRFYPLRSRKIIVSENVLSIYFHGESVKIIAVSENIMSGYFHGESINIIVVYENCFYLLPPWIQKYNCSSLKLLFSFCSTVSRWIIIIHLQNCCVCVYLCEAFPTTKLKVKGAFCGLQNTDALRSMVIVLYLFCCEVSTSLFSSVTLIEWHKHLTITLLSACAYQNSSMYEIF